MIVSNKIEVQLIVDACKKMNASQVVVSPGSRNAPFSISFDEDPFFQVFVIPDERSAAFFALGLSLESGKPTILTCTSGSAPLNYYPAIAEAFYQNVPLIVLSADRPVEWTDQGDGQTIRQQNMFQGHIKHAVQLGQIYDDTTRWFFERNLSETFQKSMLGAPGPVHINVPLSEPLYEVVNKGEKLQSWLEIGKTIQSVGDVNVLNSLWEEADNILIVIGQSLPNPNRDRLLKELMVEKNSVIMSECTSNCVGNIGVNHIDRSFAFVEGKNESSFYPQLIIQLGGAIISKKIKKFFRNSKANVIRVNDFLPFQDVFQHAVYTIACEDVEILRVLKSFPKKNKHYLDLWLKAENEMMLFHDEFVEKEAYCDLKVVQKILQSMNEKYVLHVSNSSMIRYVLLFLEGQKQAVYCNRGTSGIDGSTSTAIGFATNSNVKQVLITGDLSFFYDSNALWNDYFPENLQIHVVNNGGGDIFNIIPGPDTTNQLESIFTTKHTRSVVQLANSFGINATQINSFEEYNDLSKKNVLNAYQLIEWNTQGCNNGQVLKEYFSFLRSKSNKL